MILTVTANPSVDRTLELDTPLRRGEVQRAGVVRAQPGGKGVNVARTVAAAGLPTRALLPARAGDPLLAALDELGLPYDAVPVDGEVRSNVTIAEADGTTTKINAPGVNLTAAQLAALSALIRTYADGADWVTLCGSLPPGVPEDWYRTVADALVTAGCRVAVDTSGAPLRAAAAGRVDLIKPNEDELAELTGTDPAELRESLSRNDLRPIVAASTALVEQIGGTVLATLGARGAVLATPAGVWCATPPPIVPRSTVGAGDSSLAGFLVAQTRGASAPDCLRSAVAYGSAAAALAGTSSPAPHHLDLSGVTVTELSGAAPMN
ncbi:1-phosphofructokinase [Gordonia amicalis]|uniref:1-phosphofructokinase n=1 Tax=Gordonia amicalis TaxID=89053 RepID=UPI0002A64A14|nr:1-phosphofructokinase [Gordonia amicalis]MBA5848646.1 1-phosphofructokinase [Gordonia amicalis]MDV7098752.1 1-phosphofructokinase [Gordonia amicalis]NKX78962.1 1-phosphofructokinase [Gordonia amicalis]UOG22215.1 1-phosphofructokinase [Gordonia amicalis]GAC53420.1 1-phosphofructokinase [Gordonia amicalis NBRC 100051 = JCM 11271]